jgi:endonuclease YncB( thermonuclease family)
MGMLQRICVAAFASLLALNGSAAEKKQWLKLEACRYLPDKGNDGDNFLVQCGQEKFNIRLYYVDAPEADVTFPERVREQYEYFGVTLDVLTRAGAQARDRVRSILAPRLFVVQTRKSFAQGRSKSTRYYGLVQVDGRYLHEILLGEGLARNKGTMVALPTGEKARAHAIALQGVEDRARVERRGIWATHIPSKRVLKAPF